MSPEQQLKPLLDQRKNTIEPAETTFTTLAQLTAFAAEHSVILIPGTKPAR